MYITQNNLTASLIHQNRYMASLKYHYHGTGKQCSSKFAKPGDRKIIQRKRFSNVRECKV